MKIIFLWVYLTSTCYGFNIGYRRNISVPERLPVGLNSEITSIKSASSNFFHFFNEGWDTDHFSNSIPFRSILIAGSATVSMISFSSPAFANEVSTLSRSTDFRYFIAGGVSAAFSHGISTPIDVVKTKIQADITLQDKGLPHAATKIIRESGIGSLLSGLGPTILGYGIEGALKFGVYESLKPVFLSMFSSYGAFDVGSSYLFSAACGGAVASIVLCPMEEIRIKLVTDKSFQGRGLFHGMALLLERDGFLNSFKGFPAMLLKQVPYTIGKQVSFDMFAVALYHPLMIYSSFTQTELKVGVEILSAFLASIIACFVSHPGDVILTETYRRDGEKQDLASIAKQVYGNGGGFAFFRGILARFVHVGFIITSQLFIYDQVKQLLGLPSSGSLLNS